MDEKFLLLSTWRQGLVSLWVNLWTPE